MLKHSRGHSMQGLDSKLDYLLERPKPKSRKYALTQLTQYMQKSRI